MPDAPAPDVVSHVDVEPVLPETLAGQDPPPEAFAEWAQTLDASQHRVLWLLTHGQSITAAAKLGGVTRMTMHRWLKSDAKFEAAYHAWRQVLLESAQTWLMATLEQAVQTIRKAIEVRTVAR